eukprot:Awhi_evm1s12023
MGCNMTGRTITISKPNAIITLCEVKVFGKQPLDFFSASQSSTRNMNQDLAALAIDGNKDGDFFQGSCSHTSSEEKEKSQMWVGTLMQNS